MKSVLVILTQANLTSLQVHESLSATMVLATFGAEVKVLLQSAALSLLHSDLQFDQVHHAFKLFYDLTPILIEKKNQHSSFVAQSEQEIEFIELNSEFIQSFDHVMYW